MQIIHQLILSYQKLNYLKWYNQEDFLVDFFDEYSDIGTHWITLYELNNYVTYFDSFGVEHIPKEKIIGNKT